MKEKCLNFEYFCRLIHNSISIGRHMVDIYVLECENGNVYVGKTSKGEKRLKQHINGRGAEWTKMHKPKKVMQYYTNADDSDERKVTDQMIKKYGARKVRGAGLTKRKMTKGEIDNLNKKVGFTTTKVVKKKTIAKKTQTTYTCGRCGRQGHNKTQCYAKSTSKGKSIAVSKKSTYKKKPLQIKKKIIKSTKIKKPLKSKPKNSPKKSSRASTRKTTRTSPKRTRQYRR